MNELSDEAARRIANVDPATTAAYVVVDEHGEIHGEARLHVEGDGSAAEFALVVDPEMLGVGIGTALMRRLFEEARRRGLHEVHGTVLAQNALMLELAHRLGAQRETVSGEPDVVRVRFDLRKPLRNRKRS